MTHISSQRSKGVQIYVLSPNNNFLTQCGGRRTFDFRQGGPKSSRLQLRWQSIILDLFSQPPHNLVTMSLMLSCPNNPRQHHSYPQTAQYNISHISSSATMAPSPKISAWRDPHTNQEPYSVPMIWRGRCMTSAHIAKKAGDAEKPTRSADRANAMSSATPLEWAPNG